MDARVSPRRNHKFQGGEVIHWTGKHTGHPWWQSCRTVTQQRRQTNKQTNRQMDTADV